MTDTLNTTQANNTKSESTKGKILSGEVVSVKMQKGIVVRIHFNTIDPRFKKTVRKSKKVMVHDENKTASLGDKVRIQESRSFSKNKHYVLLDVAEKADMLTAGEA